jgi:hypothetical protein
MPFFLFIFFLYNDGRTRFSHNQKKTMQQTQKRCRFCQKGFTAENTGMLQCFHHPCLFVPLDDKNGNHIHSEFGAEHYPCCGASFRRTDPLHFEREAIRGCSPIDHCDDEEYLKIKKNPYILVELEVAQKEHPIVNQHPLPEHVFIFKTRESMPDEVTLHFAGKREAVIISAKTLCADIEALSKARMKNVIREFKEKNYIEEHRGISLELVESFLEEGGDDAHDEIRLLLKTKMALETQSFVPFCLIQRIGVRLDSSRVKRFNGNSICPLQNATLRMHASSSSLPPKKRIYRENTLQK